MSLVPAITIFFVSIASAQVPEIKHVVIIGCDGLTPAGLLQATTPNIEELKRNGAYTLQAKAVLPTISIPNWASLLMGATPTEHGAKKNGWKPHPIGKNKCGGITEGFPSIYGTLKKQRPELVTAMFHNWDGLKKVVENDHLDVLKNCKSPKGDVKCAVEFFQKGHPNLTFIYLNLIDEAGHQSGYGSGEYIKAIEKADKLIGEVIHGLKESKMYESTAIIISADHGGVNRSHGGHSKQEIQIPWMISGAGIVPDHYITSEVNIYDTAATIAYIFGVTPPVCWIGNPIKEVFQNSSETPATSSQFR